MQRPTFPIFDNHLHLDPRGRVEEAVKAFHRAGGSHLMLVHKPYHGDAEGGAGNATTAEATGPGPARRLDDFRADIDTTLTLADRVRERVPEVEVFVALSPHPAEFTQLLDAGMPMEDAKDLYRRASDLCREHVAEGRAVALAEVGRPHWEPVDPDVWDAANELMRHSFSLAKDAGCAVQVHAETATPDSYADLANHARQAGISPDKVVKHYSGPLVDEADNHGLWPSVIVGGDQAEQAIAQGTRFLMETDYMDDPRYPGAVLGPKTVPKRTLQLVEQGKMTEEQAWTVHKENPERVYGITVEP